MQSTTRQERQTWKLWNSFYHDSCSWKERLTALSNKLDSDGGFVVTGFLLQLTYGWVVHGIRSTDWSVLCLTCNQHFGLKCVIGSEVLGTFVRTRTFGKNDLHAIRWWRRRRRVHGGVQRMNVRRNIFGRISPWLWWCQWCSQSKDFNPFNANGPKFTSDLITRTFISIWSLFSSPSHSVRCVCIIMHLKSFWAERMNEK